MMGISSNTFQLLCWLRARHDVCTTFLVPGMNRSKHLLLSFGIFPSMYSLPFANTKSAVYLRFSSLHPHRVYVGSTTHNTAHREHTRYRKFLQLQHGTLINCEVALRWWKASGTFFDYTPIAIMVNVHPDTLRATEHACIQTISPQINPPRYTKFSTNIAGAAFATHPPPHKSKATARSTSKYGVVFYLLECGRCTQANTSPTKQRPGSSSPTSLPTQNDDLKPKNTSALTFFHRRRCTPFSALQNTWTSHIVHRRSRPSPTL